MKPLHRVVSRGVIVGVLVCAAAAASGQESHSAPLAKQLCAALDAAKLDSIAAQDTASPDLFVAALYFPGQLLLISAKYSAPQLLTDRIGRKEFRDTYIDLNGAAMPDSKVFVEDGGADGLRAKRADNQPLDAVEMAGKRTAFDNDWKKQKLSEQDYLKAFAAADEAYAKALTALLAQLKKTS